MLLKRRSLLGLAVGAAFAGGTTSGSSAADHPTPPDSLDPKNRRPADGLEPRPKQSLPGSGVLVLGATGFIGKRVVQALEARGVEIAAVSRRGGGAHGVALDRRNTDQVRSFVRERRLGTVIDLLAYTESDTVPLLAALDGEVGRWVMASSSDVYRNYEGLLKKANPTPTTTLITEASPLRTTRFLSRRQPRREPTDEDAYLDDYDKIPLEAALEARSSLPSVILRLPMVYGPGDRQRRFRWIVEPMLKGQMQFAVDPAWARWRTSYGYVDDVADAIVTAAFHPNLPGRIFNLGEAVPPDHRGWIDRFATSVGWHGAVIEESGRADNPGVALDLSYPLATDTAAFRTGYEWHESVAVADALARTVADEKQRG